MAVSPYDPSGRLKKHALLGTSFATDPSQTEKRRKFEELYKEAKQKGAKGYKTTKERLSARLKGYEQEQAGRLAQIAEQKRSFQEELAGLKTPEERFAEYKFIPSTFVPDPKKLEQRRMNLLGQYRQEYAQKTGDIGAAYSSLQKEEEERMKRLSDRLELYSLFLGA